MKKSIIALLISLTLLFLIPITVATQGNMKLLAVKETEDGYEGSVADLFLEIKQGSGRVFLDTYPLIKLDTQISTRFGKQIACDFLDISCDKSDFIYTITADTSIIGGPSAGASITVLTVALLSNIPIDKHTTVTGTINSGGLIGPIGGLKEKIDAGAKGGLKKILIPKGERYLKQENNTTDLVEYGKQYGVEIIEVSNIADAIYHFSGIRLKELDGNLKIDKEYANTMKRVASDLCTNSESLKKSLKNISNESSRDYEEAIKLKEKADKAFALDQYYTSASYCFGSNVKYSYINLLEKNLSKMQLIETINKIKAEVKDHTENIRAGEIRTITDLESYMVVKERLVEAEESLEQAWKSVNNSKASASNIAYAAERLKSAESWSLFFDNRGREFKINNDLIKKSCTEKLGEAEERFQYMAIFFPTSLTASLTSTKKEIDYAKKYFEEKDYPLCLFKANKAKASVDVVLSIIGVEESNIKNVIAEKLEAVKKNIVKEENKHIFPIIGYSYYEYANNLQDDDKFSALLYSEYALELSILDLYFEQKKSAIDWQIALQINQLKSRAPIFIAFSSGLLVGILSFWLVNRRKKEKRKLVINVHRGKK